MDDPYIPQTEDPKTRAVIEGTVRPASYEGRNEQGYLLCDAVVFIPMRYLSPISLFNPLG